MADIVLVPLPEIEELAWQGHALCAQTDPEAFSPKKAEAPGRPRKYAFPVRCGLSAWSMPSPKMSVLESGAGCPNVSAGA